MKFTYKWLQEIANVNADASTIAEKLTNMGLELEEIQDFSKQYSQFVVALVEFVSPHPDAKKLNICQVFDGKNKLQVVCGASNVSAGLKVAFAPIGSVIPANEMVIKKAKIRNVESNGMICSGSELCLSDDSEGIMELKESAEVGSNFAEYCGMNDTVIDICITPNRGDCANVLGVARELSAVGLAKITPFPKFDLKETGETKTKISIEDTENCNHFYLRQIFNIKQGEQYQHFHYLKMVDEEHENALVNISNFVNLTYGRPNHIYDADKISGDIVVRKSLEGEKFVALGEEEYTLPAGLTVVADDEKVLAIAGVIGGELSKVDESTKNILIEVAHFNETTVASSGQKLNIITGSRYRFERGIDQTTTNFCMDFITNEIVNICGGEVKAVNTAIAQEYQPRSLNFNYDLVKKITGVNYSVQEVTDVLTSLDFVCNKLEGDKAYNVVIPAYRNDISISEDIVEEVIRIKGLQSIKSIPLPLYLHAESFLETNFIDKATQVLKARGYDETISWSFSSISDNDKFEDIKTISIANPISLEMAVMRNSMLPNLLKSAKKNYDRSIKDLAFFELGFVYGENLKNSQQGRITGLKLGREEVKNIHGIEKDTDFFDIKTVVYEVLGLALSDLSKLRVERSENKYYHPWQSASVFLGNKLIAEFGALHPSFCKEYGFKNANLLAFEIITDNLPATIKTKKKPFNPSVYQAVNRDFAFFINDNHAVGEVLNKINKIDSLIQQIHLFDIYKNEENKSIAFNVKLQASDRTLSEEEINNISQKIISFMEKEYQAKLRDNA